MNTIEFRGESVKCVYYYLRDRNSKPIVTVCLIEYHGNYSRGMSICSPRDQFDRKVGRKTALERAIIGLHILRNSYCPETAKQLRKGRSNKAISIAPINRMEIQNYLLSYALPSFYKISIATLLELSKFELTLLDNA